MDNINQMNFNNQEFISEFGYKIFLPENWAEYRMKKTQMLF
ncbi:hypothetical protein [Flavobacterium sp. JLP]|nr:hypothetical protein [Flavobacterium sp. JLP]